MKLYKCDRSTIYDFGKPPEGTVSRWKRNPNVIIVPITVVIRCGKLAVFEFARSVDERVGVFGEQRFVRPMKRSFNPLEGDILLLAFDTTRNKAAFIQS